MTEPTETTPDVDARRDPRHAIITAVLRGPTPAGFEANRIWGRMAVDGGPEVNAWAGTPEDVADDIVNALRIADATSEGVCHWRPGGADFVTCCGVMLDALPAGDTWIHALHVADCPKHGGRLRQDVDAEAEGLYYRDRPEDYDFDPYSGVDSFRAGYRLGLRSAGVAVEGNKS
ncbi:hypothetical protein LGT39_12515 [Demequina sp. TTPB684]|uniref:hypothetical protein n=1 Tax=unclassified Demequina TaxID=2620311 RepID=UPI001CF4D215|nr:MULTISPECIES: hypothetical protein [unclassified Demequina]MCB2413668.1 hypothetical protein [Demequina sp. TTPB684]UPU87730.1 hypothetical protein LGT36_010770 [Demequina sp. TMPB413]